MSQQINLLNPLFVTRTDYFSIGNLVKGLGLVLAGCAFFSAYLFYQVRELTQSVAVASSQFATSSAQLTQLTAQLGARVKNQELEEQVRQTEKEVQAIKSVLALLKEGNMDNTEGYSAYMQALARQSMDGVWLTGFHIGSAKKDLSLEGRAIDPELLPLYINRLKSEPVLRGKSFDTLEMKATENQPNASQQTAERPAANTNRASMQGKSAAHIAFTLK